jgi:hypothetical protein
VRGSKFKRNNFKKGNQVRELKVSERNHDKVSKKGERVKLFFID